MTSIKYLFLVNKSRVICFLYFWYACKICEYPTRLFKLEWRSRFEYLEFIPNALRRRLSFHWSVVFHEIVWQTTTKFYESLLIVILISAFFLKFSDCLSCSKFSAPAFRTLSFYRINDFTHRRRRTYIADKLKRPLY